MLVQLSGVPGSGKSTLARGIAEATGFVVVDNDVLKSALITSGIATIDAGRPAYATALALCADLLAQGRSVVLDSPCRYRRPAVLGIQPCGSVGPPRHRTAEMTTRPAPVPRNVIRTEQAVAPSV